MTYSLCKKIIQRGQYEREDMQNKLDVFLLGDRISQEEYRELMVLMGFEMSLE
jgi:hypothetical protein